MKMIKKYFNFIKESNDNLMDIPDFDDIEDFDDKQEENKKKIEEETNKIKLKSEDGNVKLRMTTRLKKLLKTLQNIKGSEKVSTDLLEGIRKLSVNISFFDMVNDKNEYLSFLPKNRIVGMERIEDEKGKLRLNSYKSPQRQEMRLGRIINRILPDQFTAKEIEDFVNEYKSEHDMITGNIGIRLVDGKEIAYWYQLVEPFTCNEKVGGSNPSGGSKTGYSVVRSIAPHLGCGGRRFKSFYPNKRIKLFIEILK